MCVGSSLRPSRRARWQPSQCPLWLPWLQWRQLLTLLLRLGGELLDMALRVPLLGRLQLVVQWGDSESGVSD